MTEGAVPEVTANLEALSKFVDRENMWVSGSYATGKATAVSDLDMLVGVTDDVFNEPMGLRLRDIEDDIWKTLPKADVFFYNLTNKNKVLQIPAFTKPGGIVESSIVKELWEDAKLIREVAIPKAPAVKTEEWKLREAIADTVYGLAHGVKEEDIRKHLTRNPGLKYWLEPEDVDYILKEAKREVAGPMPESVIEYDRRYTLEELREIARQAGLSPSGSKKEIAARLIEKGVT